MWRYSIFTVLTTFFFIAESKAQQVDSTANVALDSVIISAYGSKNLMATPGAVNQITSAQLQRYNSSILQAVNSTAGVRMEERSPGSYRFNIRGSAVRSPYGVRNIKIYYNGIPFTAPGGNSMLNMLGLQNIGGIDVIKGPGSSMYGAGTGGVILFEAPHFIQQTKIEAMASVGSFGSLNYHLKLQLPQHQLSYEENKLNGYRVQTAMRRRVLAYQTQLPTFSKADLSVHLIYSNLNYQTPGALTFAEFEADPKQARPSVGSTQGAQQAKAAIEQEAVFFGVSHRYVFAPNWQNLTSVYGFYNDTKNPAIQNYELKKEPHWGGRTTFKFQKGSFSMHTGAELQNGRFSSSTYRNIQGERGNQLTDDQLHLWQWLAFAQLNWQLKQWIFTAGASFNSFHLSFLRRSETPPVNASKNFNGVVQPRFAVLFNVNSQFSAYLNVAKGFSPPASSEIFADNSSYNLALEPEKGWNIEPGLRWKLLQERLLVDASYFHQLLDNAIVTRRDAAGANYYLNAGKTRQQGVEANVLYRLTKVKSPLSANLQAAYTWHQFSYVDFVQLGQDFSGKQLPGVPQHTIAVSADLNHQSGFFGFFSINTQSKVALNDANSQYATAFEMLSVKLGYQSQKSKLPFQVFAGADNLLNQTYSLGNDINGFAGRYYNVAPARSFYMGFKLTWVKR